MMYPTDAVANEKVEIANATFLQAREENFVLEGF